VIELPYRTTNHEKVQICKRDLLSYNYVVVSDYDSPNYLVRARYSSLNKALDDIKNTWIAGRPDLIERHIDTGGKVAIFLDGAYSYSLPSADYRDMTFDAIKQINTVDFNIYQVSRRSDGAYTAFARHEFRDADNNDTIVYVSYTLTKIDGRWVIVSSGSSDNELD